MARMTVQDMTNRLHRGEHVSFRQFMNTALYCPDGYYNRSVKIGKAGADFFTAASSLLFAFGIANAIVSAWQRFSCPDVLQIVEIGAGQGELAQNIAGRLKTLLPNVRFQYTIVEKSPLLASVQQNKILGQLPSDSRSRGTNSWAWGLPGTGMGIDTVVIGNEVLDAFPVERIRKIFGVWERSYISGEPRMNALSEIWQRAPAWLDAIANKHLPVPDGCISELCLSYPSFARQCARFGRNIELIFIDYGIYLDELIAGIRPEGTARGYRRHQLNTPLADPGHVDITADVQWHIVEKVLAGAGFMDISIQNQGEFLLSQHLQSEFQELRSNLGNNPVAEMKLVGEFKQLCMPGGFGERFQVLTGRKFEG
jgi:NADH dehydrogenase [ubiquinone] 1 alpha subcomplex assembly factor 7